VGAIRNALTVRESGPRRNARGRLSLPNRYQTAVKITRQYPGNYERLEARGGNRAKQNGGYNMLKIILFAALGGLSLAALDNMPDRTLAALIGLGVMGLALAVAAKAAR
jgi:hypothetical protein